MNTREKDLAAARAQEDGGVNPDHVSRGDYFAVFADGCAHRDDQVVAWLRRRAQKLHSEGVGKSAWRSLLLAADAIDRGEHVP